jgi:hypothetical protein
MWHGDHTSWQASCQLCTLHTQKSVVSVFDTQLESPSHTLPPPSPRPRPCPPSPPPPTHTHTPHLLTIFCLLSLKHLPPSTSPPHPHIINSLAPIYSLWHGSEHLLTMAWVRSNEALQSLTGVVSVPLPTTPLRHALTPPPFTHTCNHPQTLTS